jgi:arginyl-tRNA synthetase
VISAKTFNLLEQSKIAFISNLKLLFPEISDNLFQNISVEFPENPDHGDLTTNSAMVLAKTLKKSPRLVADEIKNYFIEENQASTKILENLDSIEIAGHGFINLRFKTKFWLETLISILDDNEEYGAMSWQNCENNKQIEENEPSKSEITSQNSKYKINLEFCSANPTGPLHLGHIRGAIWGDSVAKILRFASGAGVDTEYYINDLGGQIEKLIETTYFRYKELFGEKFQLRDGYYPGTYLIETAKTLKEKFGDSLLSKSFDEVSSLIHRPVVDHMISIIKSDLAKLDIEIQNWIYESEVADEAALEEAFSILESQGLIYEGNLEKPKGYKNEDEFESDSDQSTNLIFKSSQFGDDTDRALRRSDGAWAYFAKDIAYHLNKIKRGYDWLILEVGIDHNGYKKRMEAAVNALSSGKQKFSFEFHNMVYIFEDGVQQKMSKRSGRTINTEEMINLVGIDVLKFYIFSKKHDVELDFDIKTAQESSKQNPYFYIQYAHARSCSILRNAENIYKSYLETKSDGEQEKLALNFKDLDNLELLINNVDLVSNQEKNLIKQLAFWPLCLEIAAKNLEPHRINFYLQDLANEFHSLWNLGMNNPELRFLNNKSDETMESLLKTRYRLSLVQATKNVISIGLKLLGVQPLDTM